MKNVKKVIVTLAALGVAACSASVLAACEEDEHEHDWGEWTTVTAATCDEAGKEERVCLGDSSHKETRELDALGHDWGEWEDKTAADCTHAKVEERICGHDGGHKDTHTVGEALGHDWGDWAVTDGNKPSEQPGKATRECGRDGCDGQDEKEIPALADSVYSVQSTATCGSDGVATYTYDKDGVTFSFTVEAKATGNHKWDEGKTDYPEKGKLTYSCKNCTATDTVDMEDAFGYNVTVYGADGKTALPGVTVLIGDFEGVTDADGKAVFPDVLHGEYTVTVEADGYMLVDNVVTDENADIGFSLAKVCVNNVAEHDKDGTLVYAVGIGWRDSAEIADVIEPDDVSFTVKNTGSSAATYTVALESILAFVSYPDAPVHSVGILPSSGPNAQNYKPESFVLEPGKSFTFSLTVNPDLLENSQDKNCYPVNYGVTVTRSAAPEKGSSLDYLCDGVIGGVTEWESNERVYFKLNTFEYTGGYFRFDFDEEDMKIYTLGANANFSAVELLSGNDNAVMMSDYFPTVVYATSKSGHISFTVTVTYADGSVNKPIVLEKDKNYETMTSNNDNERQVWYTFTNESETAAAYTFVPNEENGADTVVYVYDGSKTVTYSIAGNKTWFELQPGETFKLAVSNVNSKGTVAFMLRDYNPEEDINGDGIDTPYIIVVEEGTHEYRIDFKAIADKEPDSYVGVNKFYQFETAVPGYYTVEFEFDEASGASGSYIIADRFKVVGVNKNMSDYAIELNDTLCLTNGNVCILMKNTVNRDCFGTLKITFVPLTEREHTVTVVADAEVRSGLTVTVKKDGEVVATGVTDASGVATMTFIPGDYDVEISGFDAENYGYNPFGIQFNRYGNNTEVAVTALACYTFTVVSPAPEAQTVEGLDITLKNGEEIMASGKTDAEGKFTTDKIVAGVYKVEVSGTTTSYYMKSVYTDSDAKEYDLTLSEVASIVHANNNAAADIEEGRTTIKNATNARTGRFNYKFTAETDGTYVITLSSRSACGVAAVFFNDYNDSNASSAKVIYNYYLATAVAFNSELNEELGNPVQVSGEPVASYGYSSVTVTLKAGEFVVVALRLLSNNTTVTGTCDIEKIS